MSFQYFGRRDRDQDPAWHDDWPRAEIAINQAVSWGLGWGLQRTARGDSFWHWGDNGMFGNFMFGNPATGNGIVIFTNEVRGVYVCERILRETYGHDFCAFLWI